jgi:(S)-citramalyl-CoA lyase
MTNGARPTRSWLFTPATRPGRFEMAAAAEADEVMIHLEDAVALSEKDQARETTLRYPSASRPSRPAWALRINGLGTRAGLADIAALLDFAAAPARDLHLI